MMQSNGHSYQRDELATPTTTGLYEGFALSTIDTGKVQIRVRHGGDGPPLLLLHGYPQTHLMWHKVAPRLAQEFTVICPDLRGYGGSSKPPTTPDHEPYSKRAMARDQIALMLHFGFDRFAIVGHDRGARCAYRLALDHPEHIDKLALLDIVPTGEVFRRTNMAVALGYWHWFFLAQPAPLPEQLIAADPERFYFGSSHTLFHPEALADYLRAVRDPATIQAMCEDYRAGATFDYQLDEADRGQRRITCPVLVLWGANAALEPFYGDVLAVWRDWASDLCGRGLDAGHYLAEEVPDATYAELRAFFAG